jgi:hypothetical protein
MRDFSPALLRVRMPDDWFLFMNKSSGMVVTFQLGLASLFPADQWPNAQGNVDTPCRLKA